MPHRVQVYFRVDISCDVLHWSHFSISTHIRGKDVPLICNRTELCLVSGPLKVHRSALLLVASYCCSKMSLCCCGLSVILLQLLLLLHRLHLKSEFVLRMELKKNSTLRISDWYTEEDLLERKRNSVGRGVCKWIDTKTTSVCPSMNHSQFRVR